MSKVAKKKLLKFSFFIIISFSIASFFIYRNTNYCKLRGTVLYKYPFNKGITLMLVPNDDERCNDLIKKRLNKKISKTELSDSLKQISRKHRKENGSHYFKYIYPEIKEPNEFEVSLPTGYVIIISNLKDCPFYYVIDLQKDTYLLLGRRGISTLINRVHNLELK